MNQQTYDVLLLGDYFYDLIYTGLPEFPALGRECYCRDVTSTGGAMYTTAAALTRLGAHVGWVTNFGTDEYSRFVRELAEREGSILAGHECSIHLSGASPRRCRLRASVPSSPM